MKTNTYINVNYVLAVNEMSSAETATEKIDNMELSGKVMFKSTPKRCDGAVGRALLGRTEFGEDPKQARLW